MTLSDPLSPFCSERCRSLDLGNWASGRYAIPAPFSENPLNEDDQLQSAHEDGEE